MGQHALRRAVDCIAIAQQALRIAKARMYRCAGFQIAIMQLDKVF